MAFRTGICPICGATQNVDTSLQGSACTCCHAAYMVKDALVSVESAANCVQKARSLLQLRQHSRASAYIIEGLTIEPNNQELLFYYNLIDIRATGLDAGEYIRRHPYIEPYEEVWVSSGADRAEFYFKKFFVIFDEKRCALACRYIGGLPKNFKWSYWNLCGHAIAGPEGYLPLNQIEFVFSHDTQKLIEPYKQASFSIKERYGFFNNKTRNTRVYASMYDIVSGAVVLPQPHHSYEDALPSWFSLGANPSVAALIRKYYHM